MSFTLTYPTYGRGSWPANGIGGTLNSNGNGPGPYYCAPTIPTVRMPGSTGALAIATHTPCSIDDYAVFMAVKALQPHFGLTGKDVDGELGPQTGAAIMAFQKAQHIEVDGVVGPFTCQALFKPLAVSAAKSLGDTAHEAMLVQMTCGTLFLESTYDPGAVGVVDPQDLGVGQINGPAHPEISVDQRLNPLSTIPWMVKFIAGNLATMGYSEEDAIASYNLGIGGARSWIKAGRPQMFNGTNVLAYIQSVKQGA